MTSCSCATRCVLGNCFHSYLPLCLSSISDFGIGGVLEPINNGVISSKGVCNLCSLKAVSCCRRVGSPWCLRCWDLHRGTECDMRLHCVPVRRTAFLWEETNVKTFIIIMLFHSIVFQDKSRVCICSLALSLLCDILLSHTTSFCCLCFCPIQL